MENQNPIINFFRKISAGVAKRFEGNNTPVGQFFSKLMKKKLGQTNAPTGPNQRRASVINQTQVSDPNSTLLS